MRKKGYGDNKNKFKKYSTDTQSKAKSSYGRMRNGYGMKSKVKVKGASSYVVKNRLGDNQPKREVASEIIKVSPSAKEEEIVISIKKLDQKEVDKMKSEWKESQASINGKKEEEVVGGGEKKVEEEKESKNGGEGHQRKESDASKGLKNKKGRIMNYEF